MRKKMPRKKIMDKAITVVNKVNRLRLYVGLDITANEVTKIPVTAAIIKDVVEPVVGEGPIASALIVSELQTPEDSFTVGNVEWSSDEDSWDGLEFELGHVYTATVVLTAKPGYTFTGSTKANFLDYEGKVMGAAGDTLTLEYTFPMLEEME